jgi:hypothetical protein
MAEIRPIPGFPDYFADTDGNVWSRKGIGSNQNCFQPPSKTLRLLKQWNVGKNYKGVTLKRDGKKHKRYVHHIVLETFVSERPLGLYGCHGIKGKSCNALENLSWKSQQENNYNDKLRDGTLTRGEKCGSSKLTESDIRQIRLLIGSCRVIGKIYNISASHVARIKNRREWKWLE